MTVRHASVCPICLKILRKRLRNYQKSQAKHPITLIHSCQRETQMLIQQSPKQFSHNYPFTHFNRRRHEVSNIDISLIGRQQLIFSSILWSRVMSNLLLFVRILTDSRQVEPQSDYGVIISKILFSAHPEFFIFCSHGN